MSDEVDAVSTVESHRPFHHGVLLSPHAKGPDRTVSNQPSGALRGFAGIVTGSAIAQLLAIAAIPLLSRLYDPDQIARYGVLFGISSVIASFASLRLNLAIPLPSSDLDGQRLFWIAVLLPFVVLPLIGLPLLGAITVGSFGPSYDMTVDALLIATSVIIICFVTAASQLAIRVRAYRSLSRIPLIQMSGTLGAQVGLGLVGITHGLFAGSLLGRSLGVMKLTRSCNVRVEHLPDRSDVRRLIRAYWRFPLVLAPAAVVNVLGSNIVALMLPALVGYAAAGLYAMAVRVSSLPGTIIGESAGQVFLGEYSNATSQSEARRVFLLFSAALGCAGLVISTALWFLAPMVVPLVLGDKWSGTAELVKYTGVMAGAALLGSPVQHVWTVTQRALMQFAWNVIRLGSTALALWITANSGASITKTAAVLTAVTCAVYALAWFGCLYAASTPARRVASLA